MSTRTTTRNYWGPARIFSLVFGVAYLAVAVTEDLIGTPGWLMDNTIIMKMAGIHNSIHWVTGAALIIGAIAGESFARWISLVIGFVFAVVTIWGFAARDSLGDILGYNVALPWSYNFVHLVTAAGALIAAFASFMSKSRRTTTYTDRTEYPKAA